jgi:hypothetical protein
MRALGGEPGAGPNPIGLDSPAAADHLRRQLATIAVIDDLDARIPTAAGAIAEPGSELAELVRMTASVDPPVDLLLSLRSGLTTARLTLDQIALLFHARTLTHPVVLQVLTRAALLGAGRVVYVLGPEELEARRRNAETVLRQEGSSLMRGLRAMKDFQHLETLRPTPEYVAEQQRRNTAIQQQRPPGEERVLADMAAAIGQRFKRWAEDARPAEQGLGEVVTEHVTWIWHTFSGVAHGYGWPTQAPGYTEHSSGDFLADFGLVVPVVHLAFSDMSRLRVAATGVETVDGLPR